MKKIILSALVLGLLAAEARAEAIPKVRLATLSGDTLSLPSLSSGVASVLIYFNSTCELCKIELKSIGEHISEFESANILLVSSQEPSEIVEFYNNHSLKILQMSTG